MNLKTRIIGDWKLCTGTASSIGMLLQQLVRWERTSGVLGPGCSTKLAFLSCKFSCLPKTFFARFPLEYSSEKTKTMHPTPQEWECEKTQEPHSPFVCTYIRFFLLQKRRWELVLLTLLIHVCLACASWPILYVSLCYRVTIVRFNTLTPVCKNATKRVTIMCLN